MLEGHICKLRVGTWNGDESAPSAISVLGGAFAGLAPLEDASAVSVPNNQLSRAAANAEKWLTASPDPVSLESQYTRASPSYGHARAAYMHTCRVYAPCLLGATGCLHRMLLAQMRQASCAGFDVDEPLKVLMPLSS